MNEQEGKMNNYYDTCAFPKPRATKKKLLCNGYKDKPNRYCMYCGTAYAERHEVFPGSGNRQISIREGFQVDVCSAHHAELQNNITKWAQEENLRLRQMFQSEWENKLIDDGCSEDQARYAWIQMIGRSYL